MHCFAVPRGLIRLVDKRNQQLILAASYSNDGPGFLSPDLYIAGVTGEAITSSQTVWGQMFKSDRFQDWFDEFRGTPYHSFLESLEAMIAVPLLVEGQAVGVLVAYNRRDAFSEEGKRNLERIADVAALPIRHAMLNAQARLLEEMAEHFQQWLGKIGDEEAILHEALTYAQKLTGCRDGTFSILDERTQWLIRKVAVGDYLHRLPERQPFHIALTKYV